MNNGSIGQSVNVRSDLTAPEDLAIDGQIDGQAPLEKGHLGTPTAIVLANTVIVPGKVAGTITATDVIRLRETADVQGDLAAPHVGIADGGSFRGTVDMRPPRIGSASVEKTSEK